MGFEDGTLDTPEREPSKQEVEKLISEVMAQIEPPAEYLSERLNSYMFKNWRSKSPEDRLRETRDIKEPSGASHRLTYDAAFATPKDKQNSKDPCLGNKPTHCYASAKTPRLLLEQYYNFGGATTVVPRLVEEHFRKPLSSGEWEKWNPEEKIKFKQDLLAIKKALAGTLIARSAGGEYHSYKEVFDDLEKTYPVLLEILGAHALEELEKQYGVKISPLTIKVLRTSAQVFFSD